MRRDLQYAFRQLLQAPAFAFLVAITIALGIGANTAIFSVVNGFLRPLLVKAPQEIVVLAAQVKGDDAGMQYRFSYPVIEDLRKQTNTFKDVFAFDTLLAGLTVDGKTTEFLFSAVTGNCFSALGLEPAAGRLLSPGEGESPNSELVVILGYTYWQRRFGADPAVIGKQVRFDGIPTRIIGVAPKGFHGLYAGADMDGYLPLAGFSTMIRRSRDFARERPRDLFADRDSRRLTVLARLQPNVSIEAAQTTMDVVALRFAETYPATDKGIGIRVVPERLARPLPLHFVQDTGPMIRNFLLCLAGLVLLLACMNVANLLLVRTTARAREMAIRAALGSGRSRLVRQMLTESALLAVLGAGLGLVFGKWGSDLFASSIKLNIDLPTLLDFSFDWKVFVYALIGAVMTVLVISILPLRRVFETNANAVLHDGGYAGSGGRDRQRVRSVLVMAQVAGSLVLLVVAGIFVRNLQHSHEVDLGFDPAHVLNARMDSHYIGLDLPRAQEFYREVLRRVRALPGVQSAALAFSAPMGYIFGGDVIYIEGRTLASDELAPSLSYNSIDGDYFETLRIPMQQGRAFQETDSETAPLVAIVNETMAQRFWPNENPIGKRFRLTYPDAPLREIVGVAHDSKYLAVFEPSMPYFYVPLAQQFSALRTLQIRSEVPPDKLKLQVLNAIQAIEPDMPVSDIQTLQVAIDSGVGGHLLFRLGAIQATAMGMLGLVLAAIGVYGVASYGVSQRTREIGIRIAVGAHPIEILRMIMGQGVRLVLAGALVGLAAAMGLMRLTSRLLLLDSKFESLTFLLVTLLLAGVALAACYIPARRAMKVDPMIALRHE